MDRLIRKKVGVKYARILAKCNKNANYEPKRKTCEPESDNWGNLVAKI